MRLRRHKVRVVSVRFTQDEYDAITKACEAQDARSLSEFARTAMKEQLASREAKVGLAADSVDAIASRLEKVYRELRATTEHVAGMLGIPK